MVHQVYASYFPLWRHSWRMTIALQPVLYHSWCFFLPNLLQCKLFGLRLASFDMFLSLCFLAFFVLILSRFYVPLPTSMLFLWGFFVNFYSYGMCFYIPPPLLITLCGINFSPHAFKPFKCNQFHTRKDNPSLDYSIIEHQDWRIISIRTWLIYVLVLSDLWPTCVSNVLSSSQRRSYRRLDEVTKSTKKNVH